MRTITELYTIFNGKLDTISEFKTSEAGLLSSHLFSHVLTLELIERLDDISGCLNDIRDAQPTAEDVVRAMVVPCDPPPWAKPDVRPGVAPTEQSTNQDTFMPDKQLTEQSTTQPHIDNETGFEYDPFKNFS